jgi:hypothetical protein
MRELSGILPKRWWSRFLWIFAAYILVADFLPTLVMLVVNCSGYLPYSDRPGPGWQSPHLPSKDELLFFWGFAVLLLRPTAIYALALAAAGWVCGLCSFPRWLIRSLMALPAFLASGLMMAATGWMIAISSFGICLAAGCGLLWAVFISPLLVHRREPALPLLARVLIPSAFFGCGVYLLIRPFLPSRADTTTTVYVVERTPIGAAMQQLDWSGFGEMPNIQMIQSDSFAPVSLMTYSMSDKRKSRVLIILSDSSSPETKLVVPRTGDAVYEEKNGNWTILIKARKSASFGLIVKGGNEVVTDGECCHGSSGANWVFPPVSNR